MKEEGELFDSFEKIDLLNSKLRKIQNEMKNLSQNVLNIKTKLKNKIQKFKIYPREDQTKEKPVTTQPRQQNPVSPIPPAESCVSLSPSGPDPITEKIATKKSATPPPEKGKITADLGYDLNSSFNGTSSFGTCSTSSAGSVGAGVVDEKEKGNGILSFGRRSQNLMGSVKQRVKNYQQHVEKQKQ